MWVKARNSFFEKDYEKLGEIYDYFSNPYQVFLDNHLLIFISYLWSQYGITCIKLRIKIYPITLTYLCN